MADRRPVSGFGMTVAIILMAMAMIIFATGFFPYKPFLPGLAEYHDLAHTKPPPAPFDKLIFMVVDALRSDFVYSHASGFEYTQSLIADGSALPYTAHAQAPTVTMPRVKALTTGSIPSFLDLILNLAESDESSSLAAQDTWLAQMKRKSKGKLIMYGDDTWLKLFPDTFDRADGTSSFFVSDYTEVDNNVTRHVPQQLAETDWNGMILHYLGMDHIGHKSGPRSVNMLPKQKEMDSIVKQIYHAILTQPHHDATLLVLCGDHGMNDVGNHGGSAPGETSPALVFVSPKLRAVSQGKASPSSAASDFEYYQRVEQSDVVPSLAGLLGFPVPLNNLGVFIPELLSLWSDEKDRSQLLYRNALQLFDMVLATFPHAWYTDPEALLRCSSPMDTATELACLWRAVQGTAQASKAILDNRRPTEASLLAFSYKAQKSLSSTASDYNASRLYAGIVVCLIAVCLVLWILAPGMEVRTLAADGGILALAAAYIVMMFASSYVEEEQQFWYWASTAWVMAPSGTWSAPSFKSSLISALGLRILRRWNQSGQKYAGAPDIANHFLPKHPFLLLVLVLLTYVHTARQLESATLRPFGCSEKRAREIAITISILAFAFKVLFTLQDSPELFKSISAPLLQGEKQASLLFLARLVFGLICTLCAYVIAIRAFTKQNVSGSLVRALDPPLRLFLITQSRAANIPQWLVWALVNHSQHPASPVTRAVRTLLYAHLGFFANGGTNGISSVDLAAAYNGLGSYQPALTGALCFGSNFAFCFPSGCHNSDPYQGQTWIAWKRYSAYLLLWMACMVLAVMGACCALRTHLFVWTVFSPKFLYAAVWFAGWFVGGEIVLGGGLTALDCMLG